MLKEKPLAPSNALVFSLSGQNHNEFTREAALFCSFWGIPQENQFHWDPPRTMLEKNHMAGAICTELMSRKDVDLIAFFCHGFPKKIQCGFDLNNVTDLALSCKYSCTDDLRVVLYTCSSGSSPKSHLPDDGPGNGGFADKLRDDLCEHASLIWCQVDAHVTAGHTTRNPYVRRFRGRGLQAGGDGGEWLVRPGSKCWKSWKENLKTELRFAYPMMFAAEVEAVL